MNRQYGNSAGAQDPVHMERIFLLDPRDTVLSIPIYLKRAKSLSMKLASAETCSMPLCKAVAPCAHEAVQWAIDALTA